MTQAAALPGGAEGCVRVEMCIFEGKEAALDFRRAWQKAVDAAVGSESSPAGAAASTAVATGHGMAATGQSASAGSAGGGGESI